MRSKARSQGSESAAQLFTIDVTDQQLAELAGNKINVNKARVKKQMKEINSCNYNLANLHFWQQREQ